MTRRVLLWTALAALGVVLAAGVTVAASRIAGSHIGLSPVPSGGIQLAPPVTVTVPAPPPRGGDDNGRGDD